MSKCLLTCSALLVCVFVGCQDHPAAAPTVSTAPPEVIKNRDGSVKTIHTEILTFPDGSTKTIKTESTQRPDGSNEERTSIAD